ncbi:anti-sigma factor family protein [Methylomonas sp. HW2-6]|uniref:anti-sigma factor family protein n=1 Tax=Methylomonas sp. HW2-6 TaxID=3376687 RepID=UPI0040427CB8
MNSPISASVNSHADLVLLLPWYVNQSLSINERQQVENHLKTCLICRRELLNLRKLSAAVQGSADLEVAADASLAGLRMKMQRADHSRPMSSRLFPKLASRWGKPEHVASGLPDAQRRLWASVGSTGKGLAIAASLLLVIAPVALQYRLPATTGEYFTLAATTPGTESVGQLRVVFTNQLQLQEIDGLLDSVNAVRVGEPNSVGAYTVKLRSSEHNPEQALALLRGRQDVILAELIHQP